MSATRKSKPLGMSTTELLSGKMAELLMTVTMPRQEDVMFVTRRDCSRT